MSIRTVQFDEYGRKVSEDIESADEDLHERRQASEFRQVTDDPSSGR
jgi:hypothetical protein